MRLFDVIGVMLNIGTCSCTSHDGSGPEADAPAPDRATPATLTLDCGNGIALRLVRIEAGRFLMGSSVGTAGRESDETHHEVVLTKDYWIGVYEVTQSQYESMMGANPSAFRSPCNPVDNVSWDDAQAFCSAISKKTGRVVRLPSEAEWEFACRAGTDGDFSGTGRLDEMGWFRADAGPSTHGVGSRQANAWKLYDMHGNVWEWCADCYAPYPTTKTVVPNGLGRTGYDRVQRGGSYFSPSEHCRSAYRAWAPPAEKMSFYGFRVVVDVNGTDH